MASRTTHPVLGTRALNRATLARQMLLERVPVEAGEAVSRLVGLQAQNVRPPYFQLHARLASFRPAGLAAAMEAREVVRMVTLRSTIHTHTAHDALTLRPLVQAARDREVAQFRKGLGGVDLERLTRRVRDYVEDEPRTMAEIRAELLREWPGADPLGLSVAATRRLALVQVTPRGVWGRSGQVRLTTVERWLGAEAVSAAQERPQGVDDLVLRYLGAFGPASVKDMQVWAGTTRLREAFERLRPELAVFRDPEGVELFDLPGAPRPDEDTPAPPRFLPEFDNLLLSHADRSRVIPPRLKGRSWSGNQAHCTLLVDGFLAGLWRLQDGGGLTVELFDTIGAAQKDRVVAEGERLLAGMTERNGAVRFGSIRG
ncbi:winged helix DNA-binding domain-containing protein [Streptomyces sp. 2P-4]|uniref:winged helix DNA-binding domain-containing protein n=1 Tax=Streptomyces sp. 2P-4 TaxID=2931974 RepID=UPI0025411EBF|nr:winged helix DNA-binding domain-containing protein [Streptomyces sp. 2P-4]